MPFEPKRVKEVLAKSNLSADGQKAHETFLGGLAELLKKHPVSDVKSYLKAMSFQGKETEEEEEQEEEEKKEKAKCKKSAEEATAELTRVKDVLKKSVSALDAAEPQVKAALDFIAPIIGHKPVHQVLAELPAAARAQIELLQKSAEDTKKQLEELQKSAKATERGNRVRELVAKSAQTMKHVPLSADEIGEMVSDVMDASPKAAASLEKMLGAVEGVMSKSGVIGRERGSSGSESGDHSAEAEIDKLVTQLVQKSAEKGEVLAKSKAFNQVLELRPDLGKRYDQEKAAKAGTAGLGQ